MIITISGNKKSSLPELCEDQNYKSAIYIRKLKMTGNSRAYLSENWESHRYFN